MLDEKESQIELAFSSLPTERKAWLLSLLIYEITICGRNLYEEESAKEKLITLNEIQNNVSSQLTNMLTNNAKRYSDEVFVKIIFSKARAGNCEEDLITAFNFAFKNLS